jgi:hypothetical protein
MADFLTALIVALIFFGMFYGVIYAGRAYSRNQGKPKSEQKGMGCTWMLFLFFLLFLPTWGVGLWSRPVGPELWGVRILNYLFIALIFTVLIAAINAAAGEKADEDTPGLRLLKIFLGIFLGLMVLAIIAGLLL